ncbi:MAG: type II toxin-antitoxin system VapC family toxin [Acidobacteriaceae bacterium]
MILADTDVLIDYLNGASPVYEQVAHYIDAEQLVTTVITIFELLSGADEGRRGKATKAVAGSLPILSLDFASAERAAMIRRHLDQSGKSIGMADSLIAGIALASNLPLLTRNRNHFSRVPNLKLVEIPKG